MRTPINIPSIPHLLNLSGFIRLNFTCILVALSGYGFAAEPNNPLVGGRQQSSEQLYPIKLSGTPHKKYYSGKEKKLNNPLVGSRQQGSEQLFGEPPVTGTPGKSYYAHNSKVYNRPTVGGRQMSSEFLFGIPGENPQ